MTKYLDSTPFSINNAGNEAYAKGWDAVFGPKSKFDIAETSKKLVEDYEKFAGLRKSDIRRQVEEFHRAMGQPVADKPSIPSPERMKLRLRLITEEFHELLDACDTDDTQYFHGEMDDYTHTREMEYEALDNWSGETDPEALTAIADALADLDYVIEGMRLELGINGKPIADEVHRSNMSKLGDDGRPVLNTMGKITKGPNYSPPDIRGELVKQGWQP